MKEEHMRNYILVEVDLMSELLDWIVVVLLLYRCT